MLPLSTPSTLKVVLNALASAIKCTYANMLNVNFSFSIFSEMTHPVEVSRTFFIILSLVVYGHFVYFRISLFIGYLVAVLLFDLTVMYFSNASLIKLAFLDGYYMFSLTYGPMQASY